MLSEKSEVAGLLVPPSAVLNRAYDESATNVPARTMDRFAVASCQGSCQCVSCQNTGCNK